MSRDKSRLICYDWMLEFLCHDIWQTYSTGGDIDQGVEDLANGIMLSQRDRSGEAVKGKEVAFLNLLIYLSAVKRNSKDKSNEVDSEQFELEHVQRVLDDLSFYCNSDEVVELSGKACQKTLLQIFFTLCRQNQFEKAQELFDSEDADCLGKDARRKIQTILNAKNELHHFLTEDTLTDYISTMTQYLEAVYHTFPSQPVLLKVVKNVIRKQSPVKGIRCMRREIMKNGHDETVDEEGNLDKEEEELNSRLQDIRNKNLKEVAESVANLNNSMDDTVEEGDSEADGDVQTSQERKRGGSRKSGQNGHKKKRLDDHGNAGVSSTHSDPESIESGSSDGEQATSSKSLQQRVKHKVLEFKKRSSLAPSTKTKKAHRQQRRMKWTLREEEDFYKAVQRHGVGQWLLIRQDLKTGRSNVQLKDKWRTILNNSYNELNGKFGPVETEENL